MRRFGLAARGEAIDRKKPSGIRIGAATSAYRTSQCSAAGEICLFYEQQADEGEDHKHPGVGVTCPPQVLTHWLSR